MIEKIIVTKEEFIDLKTRDCFIPRTMQESFFKRLVLEYEERSLKTFIPDITSYQGKDLAVCYDCKIIYPVTRTRDIFLFEGDDTARCYGCATTQAVWDMNKSKNQ